MNLEVTNCRIAGPTQTFSVRRPLEAVSCVRPQETQSRVRFREPVQLRDAPICSSLNNTAISDVVNDH